MAKLPAEVKMRVATRELTLPQALADAGIEIPEWLRTGASAPTDAPVPRGDVEPSLTGADPQSELKPEDARPASVSPPTPAPASADPKEAKRAEAQRKLALMQRLPSELKLRVAKREISLEDAMREAGVEPE